MRRLEATVAVGGQRLDRWLQAEWSEYSRAFWQKLVGGGQVRVNERTVKASYRVRVGDRVVAELPAARPLGLEPEAMALEVLYEDAELIVINKPAGLVVHPGAGHAAHTLVQALLYHCRGQLSGIGGVERPGIVHRLDKGTSGCLVAAKTDRAHQSLAAQFRARAVKKIYRAVCRGRFARSSGRVETLIGRSARDRQKMSAVVRRGKPAVTEYRVLRQAADWALVELGLQTGRTHQIRVHMKHLGHPLVGDVTYGGGSEKAVERPLLHAYKLGFRHPVTGEWMEFVAPVPQDMSRYE